LRDWLKGIAANRVREFRRRGARGKERQAPSSNSETDFLARVPDEPQPQAWDREWTNHILSLCLEAVRAEFDTKTFRAFELYAVRDRSADVVAQELGVSRNAVYIAKSRVLDRMQTLFRDLDAPLGVPG
jgi:RNA polymerase sigma-70 factor (ECF subfamily)